MKIRSLAVVATFALVSSVHAGPIRDRFTAETRETRNGREYRTLLTMTYDGGVQFNGLAEWKGDVLCEMRDTKTGKVETFTGAGPAALAQGAFEGRTKTVGEFHIQEPDVDGGVVVKKGVLEMSDKRCASGTPVVVNGQAPKAASLTDTSTAPAGKALGNNGKPFDGYTWYHNGSDMLVDEDYGEIRYDKPKALIAKAVKPGDVLFRGAFHKDGTVEGTAFAFKLGCPPAPYPVKGRYPKPATFVDGRMVLTGPGPRRKEGSCEVDKLTSSSSHSKLVFDVGGDI
ncbi:hypothetical protein [Methylobacterium sp. Leaf93]|uniref:hypothetical protein n=1 Tax=Methylobacterium sp. Leaf93 TaxID=1736249 RepID=UPI000701D1C4|nr:hypothetical protein [Methylobacterium sp. Leaf93]KQP16537.1 hypothetical protein ASF26_01495 [Methylobacterium sp. Leaf93]